MEDLAAGRLRRILPDWQAKPTPVYALTETRLLPAKTQRCGAGTRRPAVRSPAVDPVFLGHDRPAQGHGGVLANSMVTMVLHNDLHPGDRVLWAVNTSWMVGSAHVLGLLGGATPVLYDGAVTGAGAEPDWGHLWKLAGRLGVNIFGGGAAIHHACLKAGIVPRDIADLRALHTVCSTGSPLSPEAYRWLYDAVKADIWLNTVSGGTDIAGGFVVGLPTLPVYLGEMQCRALGTSVQAWNDQGQPVMDAVGELICTRPLSSMPLRFWGDPGNARYLESYFESFEDAQGRKVWRHGDWLRLVPRPEAVGGVIYGRSDATINRQGVRMGTAELYRKVEALDEVLDSLVVDLEYLGRESCMALFVQLRPGMTLDAALDRRIRQALREGLSARHVPNEIFAVDGIPKTITGKKLELPIRSCSWGTRWSRWSSARTRIASAALALDAGAWRDEKLHSAMFGVQWLLPEADMHWSRVHARTARLPALLPVNVFSGFTPRR